MVSSLMSITPSSGTCFDQGLWAAHQQLTQDSAAGANQGRTPVFVLLTDSEDCSPRTVATLQEIMRLQAGTGLRMHCFGFGHRVYTGYMEQLAAIGNGAFYNNLQSDDLARWEESAFFISLCLRAFSVVLLPSLRSATLTLTLTLWRVITQ